MSFVSWAPPICRGEGALTASLAPVPPVPHPGRRLPLPAQVRWSTLTTGSSSGSANPGAWRYRARISFSLVHLVLKVCSPVCPVLRGCSRVRARVRGFSRPLGRGPSPSLLPVPHSLGSELCVGHPVLPSPPSLFHSYDSAEPGWHFPCSAVQDHRGSERLVRHAGPHCT